MKDKHIILRIVVIILAIAILVVVRCKGPIVYIFNRGDYDIVNAKIVDEHSEGGRYKTMYAKIEYKDTSGAILEENVPKNFWEHSGDTIKVAVSQTGTNFIPIMRIVCIVQGGDIFIVGIVILGMIELFKRL